MTAKNGHSNHPHTHTGEHETKNPDWTEIRDGLRVYTAWRGSFVFGATDDGRPEKRYDDVRIIWSGHYNGSDVEAAYRQEREIPNLAQAIAQCPGAIPELKPDGFVRVYMTEGQGALRNRAFNTPLGVAFALEGDVLSEAVGEDETATSDVFEDNPPKMSDLLAALLGSIGSGAGDDALGDTLLGSDPEERS